MQQLFFTDAQYFRRPEANENTVYAPVFSSAREADETSYDYFCQSSRPMKQLHLFCQQCWLTKINVFSSVADENTFIFIDFILSVYFHRPTDEYIYIRRFSGYF
jgi:hypothetical protein